MHFTSKLLFAVAIALSLAGAAWAADEENSEDFPTCYISGERWDTSSTRVEVIFLMDAEYVRGRFLNLAYMLMAIELFSEQGYNIETAEIQMVDYTTFGTENEKMLKLTEAGTNILILFTDNKLEGSAEPYMAAFPSRDSALATMETEGFTGEVLSWDKAIDKLIQAMLTDNQGMPDAMGEFH